MPRKVLLSFLFLSFTAVSIAADRAFKKFPIREISN